MVTEDEKNKKDESKGFAGISSLVSDVDTSPSPVTKNEPTSISDASSGQSAPVSQTTQSHPGQQQTYQNVPQPSSGSSGGKWVLGIAVVIGVLWLIGQSNTTTSSPAPTYSIPAQSTGQSYSSLTQPQQPSRPTESQPPVGQDLVFTAAQIRYCLSEDIRMEGVRSALSNHSDSDVDRFNAMVADYNSRCSSFRYRGGALESARRDIEPYRSKLQAEGRDRFDRGQFTDSLSASAPTNPAPDATVQAIQERLKELGYNAGTPDGVMGKATRTAIVAFQRDTGLNPDGLPSSSLLQQLLVKHQSEAPEPPQEVTAVSPSFLVEPPAVITPQRTSSNPKQTTASVTEQSAVERACDSARIYSSPSDYQACLAREMASLKSSGGRPDMSRVTDSERNAIERVCDSVRKYSGPGAYYNCLKREISSLNASRGRPDLSGASPSEQAAIERACDSERQYSGPGAYYSCLSRELSSLKVSRGQPDLSRLTAFEQAAIKRACESERQYSGPGALYNCLNREVSSLRSSGGAPDFSNLTPTASAAVERACESSRQYSGPGTYYNCLRREIGKVGYR